MVKKLLLTTLAGALIYFLEGWFTFEFILGDYTASHTTQISGLKKNGTEYSLNSLIISCMAYALLLTVLLVYFMNITDLKKGLLIGSIVGVLVALMVDSYLYASTYFYSNLTVIFLDILGAGVSVGILGLVIALINKIIK